MLISIIYVYKYDYAKEQKRRRRRSAMRLTRLYQYEQCKYGSIGLERLRKWSAHTDNNNNNNQNPKKNQLLRNKTLGTKALENKLAIQTTRGDLI